MNAKSCHMIHFTRNYIQFQTQCIQCIATTKALVYPQTRLQRVVTYLMHSQRFLICILQVILIPRHYDSREWILSGIQPMKSPNVMYIARKKI